MTRYVVLSTAAQADEDTRLIEQIDALQFHVQKQGLVARTQSK